MFAMNAGGPMPPCAPPANGSAPMPCGPPLVVASCAPGANGTMQCGPPPGCGGTAFGGAGAAGCAPPAFCTANAAGAYDCRPPEDCRAGPDGRSRCAPPPVGAACQRMLQGEAAAGAFVPCAAPPTQFCPPPPPGEQPKCGAPPAPPRFCVGDEPMFPADHPAGAPPVCIPAPGIVNGQYRAPIDLANAGGNCVPPPPGEWPPAQPAPEGKVWCPPMGFAPPPPPGQGFGAWQNFTRDRLPPQMQGFVFDQARKWDGVNESALAELTRIGAVNQMFAPPSFDGRLMNGSFARAQLDESFGVRDFRVGGTPFFGNITPTFGRPLDPNASLATAAGTAVIHANEHAVFETHNVPAGLMAYRGIGQPFPVRFETNDTGDGIDIVEPELEEGEEVGVDPTNVRARKPLDYALLMQGEWRGVLIGDLQANGTGLDATVTDRTPVFFMAIPPTGLESETRLDIAEGVAEGKVFAEVSIIERNDTTAEDLTFYEDPDTFTLDVVDVTKDNVTIDISGEGDGQALVFTVDRETLTTPLSDLNVTIDGETLDECATFDELTGSADEGGCFYVVANETTLRVSVMPEHFSEHTIVIGAIEQAAAPADEGDEAEGPASTPTGDATDDTTPTPATTSPTTETPASDAEKGTPGLGAFAIVGAVAAVAVLFRRRKES